MRVVLFRSREITSIMPFSFLCVFLGVEICNNAKLVKYNYDAFFKRFF